MRDTVFVSLLFFNFMNNHKFSLSKVVYSALGTLLLCVMCVLLLFTFIFRTVIVDGNSMNPGLSDGDKIIISNFLYNPDYGDIIAIGRTPDDAGAIIKRVIALGGDEVNINFETHIITVNGRVITENYRVAAPISHKGDVDFPVTVPEGCVFVLGDNRNDSRDSRFSDIGFIDLGDISGKAIIRISPYGGFGIK